MNINMHFTLQTIKKELDFVQDQIVLLENSIKQGTMYETDVIEELQNLMTREDALKEKYVLKVHVTSDGVQRKIEYKESKQMWMTIMPDKRKIHAKTREGLIQKLFDAYDLKLEGFSFSNIFDKAIDQKEKTENKNQGTILKLKNDYELFIDKDLANKDIRKITKFDLMEYTQTMVNNLHPTKKKFFAYKGILNLVFSYAIEHEIISKNPVTAIKNSNYYKSCNTQKTKPEDKILSESDIQIVENTVRKYMTYKKYGDYFINGFAILFSIETGVRVGEIPALKWEDVKDDYINIHAQQLSIRNKGGKTYYYAPWTKDEKGNSQGGRNYPLTDKIKDILTELKLIQIQKNIKSEYIFCHEDGEWIKTDAYETCLRRMMQCLGFSITNNHAFRMSLNSNIFIGRLNLPVTERARLLGHSVETNEKHYSFAGKDNIADICELLNEVTPRLHPKHQNVIDFETKKHPKTLVN